MKPRSVIAEMLRRKNTAEDRGFLPVEEKQLHDHQQDGEDEHLAAAAVQDAAPFASDHLFDGLGPQFRRGLPLERQRTWPGTAMRTPIAGRMATILDRGLARRVRFTVPEIPVWRQAEDNRRTV